MKIWRLHSSNYSVAHLFASNEKEQQYYIKALESLNKGNLVQSNWQPTMLCNSGEYDFNKFISSGKEYWAITEKTKKVMETLFKQSFEFLPLYSKKEVSKKISSLKQLIHKKNYNPVIASVSEQKLYLWNVLDYKSTEVINLEASVLDYQKKKNIFHNIEKLVFRKEQIKDSPVFAINNLTPYFNNTIFVSDQFRKIVQKNNLTGLNFINQLEEDGGNLVWSQPS